MVAGRPVGAHAPTAGGIAKTALPYLDATAAEAVQVFAGNPRGWARHPGDPEQDARFVAGCRERGDLPVFVHAPLLVNLGSPTPVTVTRSAAALAHSLERGAAIGARAVVFHAGSAVAAGRRHQRCARCGKRCCRCSTGPRRQAGRGCWWNRARAAVTR